MAVGRLLEIFLFVACFKFLHNLSRYFRVKALYRKYLVWLAAGGETDFVTYKSECIELFKFANVKDSRLLDELPSAYDGVAYQSQTSVFDNFPSLREYHASSESKKFSEAIGEYRKRFFQALCPLYWLNLIAFAPRHLLDYLGLDKEAAAARTLGAVLTGAWWLAAAALAFFNQQVKALVIDLLKIAP